MEPPAVSIVSVTHGRAELLRQTFLSLAAQTFQDFELILVEDGESGGAVERAAREAFPSVRYFQRKKRPALLMSNPAVPLNIGLRQARGDLLVYLLGDCAFADTRGLEHLVEYQGGSDCRVVMASIRSLDRRGRPDIWFCHPTANPRLHLAATCLPRAMAIAVGGMDEDFVGYGFDDDDMAFRLGRMGAEFIWTDVLVLHQWHLSHRDYNLEANQRRFEGKRAAILAGGSPVANLGKDWGALDS